MVMTEDEMVNLVFRRKFFSELIKRLIRSTERVCLDMSQTVVPRPSVPQTECHPGMKHAEKKLQDTVMEDAAKNAIAERNRAKTVSMTQAELLA